MAASVAQAVQDALTAHFATGNAALVLAGRGQQAVSVYDTTIPGSPTDRYVVMYVPDPRPSNSTVDGLSRDGVGRFQVTVAATSPDSVSPPAPMTGWLVREVRAALVDHTLAVDGWQPFIVQQSDVDTYPIPVEVVADRLTVEHALEFTYLTDKA